MVEMDYLSLQQLLGSQRVCNLDKKPLGRRVSLLPSTRLVHWGGPYRCPETSRGDHIVLSEISSYEVPEHCCLDRVQIRLLQGKGSSRASEDALAHSSGPTWNDLPCTIHGELWRDFESVTLSVKRRKGDQEA